MSATNTPANLRARPELEPRHSRGELDRIVRELLPRLQCKNCPPRTPRPPARFTKELLQLPTRVTHPQHKGYRHFPVRCGRTKPLVIGSGALDRFRNGAGGCPGAQAPRPR